MEKENTGAAFISGETSYKNSLPTATNLCAGEMCSAVVYILEATKFVKSNDKNTKTNY